MVTPSLRGPAMRLVYVLLIAWTSAMPVLVDVPAINLDLLRTHRAELDAQYQTQVQHRYFNATNVPNIVVIDDDTEIPAEYRSGGITKYEVSKREAFNEAKMKYVVEKNPKSVVFFKDSNTVLVPSDDILKSAVAKTKMTYVELALVEIGNYFEPNLIPASSCLEFPLGKGSGSVGVKHTIGISITPKGGASVSLLLPMVIGTKFGFNVGFSASFSSKYTCSTQNGKSLRLFYKINLLTVGGKKRNFVYDKLAGLLHKEDWMNLSHEKFITDNLPIYYCGSSDLMDLKCDTTGVEFSDDDRNTFQSKLN